MMRGVSPKRLKAAATPETRGVPNEGKQFLYGAARPRPRRQRRVPDRGSSSSTGDTSTAAALSSQNQQRSLAFRSEDRPSLQRREIGRSGATGRRRRRGGTGPSIPSFWNGPTLLVSRQSRSHWRSWRALAVPTSPISIDTAFGEARHIMIERNYSQLAVVDPGGEFLGVSHHERQRSMRAHLTSPEPSLREVLDEQVPCAYRQEHLLRRSRDREHGFVFVRSLDRKSIDGIITAADLTGNFDTFVGPFVMLEEIERRLRMSSTLRSRSPRSESRQTQGGERA